MTPEQCLAAIGDPDDAVNQKACQQALVYQEKGEITGDQINARFKEIYQPLFNHLLTEFMAGTLFPQQATDYEGALILHPGVINKSVDDFREFQGFAEMVGTVKEFTIVEAFFKSKMSITPLFRSCCMEREDREWSVVSINAMKERGKSLWYDRINLYNKTKRRFGWDFEPSMVVGQADGDSFIE